MKKEKKKVLIICYYWPPAGGPGVQRWLKFVKYLPDFNIEPIVYVPDGANYPLIDTQLEQEVDPSITILRHKIKEPYGLAKKLAGQRAQTMSSGMIPQVRNQSKWDKLLLWIRGNMFIPDARIGWVKPSVAYLKDYLKQHPDIDTIITTGPPHSVHLIGLALKKKLHVKWFADFRDPWTTIGYHKELKLSDQAKEKHIALEREVLNTADQLIVTSKTTRKEFETKTDKPIAIITNGYDVVHLGKIPLDEKFTLAHIGSFLSNRNPRVLWKAISELRRENQAFKEAFELKLIGKISEDILHTLEEFKLLECTDNRGYVENQEALRQMRASQVLLLVEIDSDDTRAIIPGKLFEYMAAERPILAIGPEESDFFEIIQQTNVGRNALYSEKDKIREILMQYFEQYQNKQLQVHAMGLQYFGRKRLTERLVSVLEGK
ncbi:glycosyltransferase involved in cell wall biosynthesis [Myroides gitamensis]|uniref:glycosyltransferase family 4 protein n=1 Tax=Myroides odoratus TaxID=256 RepID=UPI0021694AF1|nr:glycosyltransferase family 4 protein [Myroides odoratus]MCS4240025.1 glycosyltransferase involved in cell wall biosynthesis [Myroides odoratus]MDH6600266.1 glycosyltransferase involved in cell wall biosynthesis [Myroides gitamensis]